MKLRKLPSLPQLLTLQTLLGLRVAARNVSNCPPTADLVTVSNGSNYSHSEPSNRKSRGFALLFTLVVVGVIGGIAFGVGRLALTELKQTNRFQDSQTAYQAAEAGIEYGLLRFRYDRDTQMPIKSRDNCSADASEQPTFKSKHVLRVNLTTGRKECVDPTTALPPDPSQIVYDLKVHFLDTELGDFDASVLTDTTLPDGQRVAIKVKRDEIIEINRAQNLNGALTLRWKADKDPTYTNSIKGELRFINPNSTMTPIITKPVLDSDVLKLENIFGFANIVFPGTTTIQFKPFIGGVLVAAKGATSSGLIDFGFTYIEATGYSSGTKRKLTTTINRSSGTARGVYNFTLFSGTSNLGQ